MVHRNCVVCASVCECYVCVSSHPRSILAKVSTKVNKSIGLHAWPTQLTAPGTTISGPLPASTMTIRGNAQKIIVFHHLTSGDVRVQNLRFLASPKEITL